MPASPQFAVCWQCQNAGKRKNLKGVKLLKTHGISLNFTFPIFSAVSDRGFLYKKDCCCW